MPQSSAYHHAIIECTNAQRDNRSKSYSQFDRVSPHVYILSHLLFMDTQSDTEIVNGNNLLDNAKGNILDKCNDEDAMTE